MLPEEIKTAIKDKFSALLAEAGTDINAPDLMPTWEAFKAFAGTHVEQTHGGLLFECGAANWGEGGFFEVSFLRFFYLEVEEGWDDCMVRVAFSFLPGPELPQFGISISADVDAASTPNVFVDEVEAYQVLWQALQHFPVHHCTVYVGSQ